MLFNKLSPITLSLLSYFNSAIADSSSSSSDFPTIEVVGNKFFYSNNGSQFYIRGVAYQQNTANLTTDDSFVDPLADEETCKRDIPYLTELNTNVLRVYALNASANHDSCMQLLQDAGIYVIADLAEPTLAISTTDPEWTLELYDRYTSVIDMMQGYDNVLGFFAGNEVITNSTNTNAAPFVKAAIRDMKSYISDKGYRDIPVGYSANDDANTRVSSADYFDCGDNDIKADFYGINMYEWCGTKTFQSSGYEDRTKEFSNLTVPIFFSEYGCNAVQPRKFTEIGTIFSDEMTDVWSGGIVYMYYQEENNYGLVSVVNEDKVSTMEDFQYYSSEINNISPTSAKSSDISTADKTLACPTNNNHWKAATSLPPTPDSDTCDCMYKSLSCIISDDVDEEDYEDLFSYVCGLIDCSNINTNGAEGEYGSFSFCSSKDKLSYILNLYYEDQDEKSSACDFSGSASLVSGKTESTCKSVLAAASSSGVKSTKKTSKKASSKATTTSSSSGASSTSGSDSSASSSDSSSDSGKTTDKSTTKDSKTTKTSSSSSASSSVSSISSTSKGDADVIRSSSIMGFFSLIAALLI